VKRDEMVEIDAAVIMPKPSSWPPDTSPTSPTHNRVHQLPRDLQADKLIEEKLGRSTPENLPDEKFDELLKENGFAA